jgi:hypothetical protein
MQNRWTSLLVGVALSGATHLALGDGNQSPNSPPPTNTLAIYLVTDRVPVESIILGTTTPAGLKLATTPLVSDTDFKSYDLTTHTFTVPAPIGAKIVTAGFEHGPAPFVLVAGGQSIYVGVFTTSASSTSSDLPTIEVGIPGADERGAYGFTIDRGYPGPNGFGRGEDRRTDPRIVAAAAKLFPKKGQTTTASPGSK